MADLTGGDALVGALVRLALSEDVGPGDVTTLAAVEPDSRARGAVVAREPGVLSGTLPALEVARAVDPAVRSTCLFKDGDVFSVDDVLIELEGPARSLLTMERVLLNFLQRLTGVATLTRAFVDAVAGTGVQIADTRKTTPGLRLLEKQAVVHGGGVNHRHGLYDAYMVKDNHVIAAGSLSHAVERIRAREGKLPIIVEARTSAEVEEAARLGVDQILLDNMTPREIAAAVQAIRSIENTSGLPRARIEVSGGVTLGTVREKALPGVDWISIGALTHSARAIDLSLDIEL